MVTEAVRSPGSRLSDDLYRIYLVALSWLVFPVYGDFFAAILPTTETTLRWVYPVAAVLVQLAWLWSGSRGGPMTVSRASIVHELGAAVSARTVLLPQLLRQGLAWGGGGAVVGGVLTSVGGEFSFPIALGVSAGSFLLGFSAVMWGTVLMIELRDSGSTRGWFVSGAVVVAVVVAIVVLIERSVSNVTALATLAVVTVLGGALAWHSLDRIPVALQWERARNLESARSAMLEVDFHRMLIDLRGAGDNKPAGVTKLPPSWGLSLWRAATPLRHAMPWSGIRIALSVVSGFLLLAFTPLEQGAVLVAFGAVWLVLGYELTRGLAAIADQVAFSVHYPSSSTPLLLGQLIASLALGSLGIAVAIAWRFASDQTEALAATLIAAMGIVGGAMQARLGSPDTTSFVAKYGLQFAAGLLWARAAAAPLAVLLTAVFVFHGVLEPAEVVAGIDLARLARSLIPVVFVVALFVSVQPLRREAR